ncbi:hypothetical protein [Desulfopila sp. IMCC35008]|nr:hypothetical protein [Desulfopila sp. IMCC35008]
MDEDVNITGGAENAGNPYIAGGWHIMKSGYGVVVEASGGQW